jgi:UDP-N-acetylglucosamine--N-acetylmuramyl-(pentapeptide) pyrophosphoryl-undecaprenol N-acetylglucosamine transferase
MSAAATLRHAREFLKRTSPRVVVSIGGYAAGPVSLAAAMLGIPVTIVEPNSVMGLSNKVVAPLARRLYLAFDEARPAFFSREVRLSGVPLRDGFAPRTASRSEARRVLVLGGSQGALALNERLPPALALVAKRLGAPLSIVHQAGAGKDDAVRDAYARAGLGAAIVIPFTESLADELSYADVVVARAGAGTIAEIAAVGRASVLIPLPTAAGDHQAKNAAAYARSGAAVWLRQDAADPTRLADEIALLLGDDARLARMAAAAESQGRPEAARTIARDLLDVMEAA